MWTKQNEWRGRGGAALGWKVQRAKVRYHAERDGTDTREWADQCVLFRSDDKAPLALAPSKLRVLQPFEILEHFRTAGELELVGELHRGAVLWALTAPLSNMVPQPMAARLLLRARIGLPLIEQRPVVEAQGALHPLLESCKEEKLPGEFGAFAAAARCLAGLALDKSKVDQLTRLLLAPPGPGALAALSPEQRQLLLGRQRESRNYRSIMELSGARTAWDWVCAVAEHVDWRAHAKNDDERLEAAWFGRGSGLKVKARALALSMLEEESTT